MQHCLVFLHDTNLSSDAREQRPFSTSTRGRLPINSDVYPGHIAEIRARPSASQTIEQGSVLEFSSQVVYAALMRTSQEHQQEFPLSHNTKKRVVLRSYPQLLPRVQERFAAQAQTASSIFWRIKPCLVGHCASGDKPWRACYLRQTAEWWR